MRHYTHADADNYPVAVLVKGSAFKKAEIDRAVMTPLAAAGVDTDDVIVCALEYNDKGKAPVAHIKEQLESLLPALDSVGTKYLYCADANYFKTLTKSGKAEPHLGYILKCGIKDYEHMEVILGVNHRSLVYNPANEPKLALSLQTLSDTINGSYTGLGSDIIKNACYPRDPAIIKTMLDDLKDKPALTCDIEGFSLDHDKAGVATITFCWNEHEGIAFPVDYKPLAKPEGGMYGAYVPNPEVHAILREFFETYTGILIFHNAPYDTKCLIYTLWMEDLLDTNGLLKGLEIMFRQIQDTKIILYLATNSTAGNELSLKKAAHLFAGNWAQDDENIKDIRRIPEDQLLEYNLVDGLATWYVYNKFYPIMTRDMQEGLYYKLMLPSQKTITQIELTGMPLDRKEVLRARRKLRAIVKEQDAILARCQTITDLEDSLTKRNYEKDYEDRKKKAKHPDKIKYKDWDIYPKHEYNPGSGPQTQVLLYEMMGLPVIDKTKGKQPATGAKTLKKLVHHTDNPQYIEVIEALRARAKADKILNTFIKAFLLAIDKGDGVVWLHGSFNLGGTVSGRLSSSNPNLQNLPAGSTYGKMIKACFTAPKGWIFCGADFNSLEDYISALTTKDPNKLKVYLEGYDGHCLRAFSYFPEKLPDIVNTVESINSIADKYPKVRQDSKAPTFALTYQGTWITLHKNLGFTPDLARQIEQYYHDLYVVSDEWVKAKLDEASKTGYVEVAFGLRLRTPLLAQTIRGHRTTPYEAEAEGRTAGNALGQSYGLLNNRAVNEFMQKVWESPYRFDIKPVALIHDAIYLLARDDVEVIRWVNENLIHAMQWQELPEIKHDTVKLGAELSLFWPSWADELVLPNDSTTQQIRDLVVDHREKLLDKDKAVA